MNIQQRRPLPQPSIRETDPQQRKSCFRPWGRIVALSMALLFTSCASLTPNQISLLSALAGSAAQIGLQLYLQNNPTHRPGVQAVVDALKMIQVPTEQSVATEMQSLPTTTLKGPDSELYVADTGKLVIWDSKRGKAFDVPEGLAGEAIAKAVRDGMKRGMVPKPPMPERTTRRAVTPAPHVIYVTNQQVIVLPANEPAFATVRPQPTPVPQFTPSPIIGQPVVESPTPAPPVGKSSARVGIYRVEKSQGGTNWVEVQSFSSGVGEFRVKRVR